MKEYFLIVGVIIGAIMWGSITTLLENNGVIAIFGLAFSSIILGGCVGTNIRRKHD